MSCFGCIFDGQIIVCCQSSCLHYEKDFVESMHLWLDCSHCCAPVVGLLHIIHVTITVYVNQICIVNYYLFIFIFSVS